MTHDELLADIDSKNIRESRTPETPYAALRAVVELHKCSNPRFDLLCDCGTAYPCPTIQAIEEQLK